jgi:hypothetical protein
MFNLKAPILQLTIHQLAGNRIPMVHGGRNCGKSRSTLQILKYWLVKQRAANDPIRPLRYV